MASQHPHQKCLQAGQVAQNSTIHEVYSSTEATKEQEFCRSLSYFICLHQHHCPTDAELF